ncbi:hypothetical protein [Streptomyces sp. NPDC101455]|uniref:hypothetical protein n=1 Tax=Streptomyces sp. NPDC101455 TaxID=3366142 RepID=UPI003806BAC2
MTTAGAFYESLRARGEGLRPTRLLVLSAGSLESVVVDGYTGRRRRTIPSSRLHDVGYQVDARRTVRSGYLRLGTFSHHLADLVRGALRSRGFDDELISGASVTSDPVTGGTLSMACPPADGAVACVMEALVALGWSAVLVRDRSGRTVLRVRYGRGDVFCPVRWIPRDGEWKARYCGKLLGHDDGEHQDLRSLHLLWDGDDDGLDWQPAPRPDGPITLSPSAGRAERSLAVLQDAIRDTDRVLRPDDLYFILQVRTTALRRHSQAHLRTCGPLEQVEPEGVTTVTDGSGRRWGRRSDGLWVQAPTHSPDGFVPAPIPWHALAFEAGPLTEVPAQLPDGSR